MPTTANGTAFDLTGDRNHPAVVLIHGLGLRRLMWDHHVPTLKQNHCVLSYDLFGHGDSDPPATEPTLKLFADQLRDLLDELAIAKCTIVGFSLGGMINRMFAMNHPDRVESLVILNSPHERDPEEQRLVEQRATQTAAGGPASTLDSTLARWFTPKFLASQSKEIDRVRNWVLSNDLQVYTACRVVLATGVKELINPNPPIFKPTLVATCENDSGSTPRMSHAIAAEISQAKTVIVPKLRHLGVLEEPNVFVGLILNFLEQPA